MKLFGIFAGTLMLSGIAAAGTIVIDDYTTPAGIVEDPVATCGASSNTSTNVGTNILGGSGLRSMEVTRTAGGGCTQGALFDSPDEYLGLGNSSNSTFGELWVTVNNDTTNDGIDDSTAFSLELVGGPADQLMFDYVSDAAGSIEVIFNLDGGGFETTGQIAVGSTGNVFTPFMMNIDAWDLSAVRSVSVVLRSTTAGALDLGIDNLKVTDVPEPGSMFLIGAGLIGLATYRRRSA